MARRRSAFEQVRRTLYKTQRTMGDFQAAGRGPGPLVRRLARRQERRMLGRFLRRFGL
ncbi:MAG: hypothetical protein ACOYXW_18245 [Actinomycetota bacterium]